MCVFIQERLFTDRWRANGGKPRMEAGTFGSWNYGSPQGEAVLVVCGGDLPEGDILYPFESNEAIYLCRAQDGMLLDIFIVLDSSDSNGHFVQQDEVQSKAG